MNQLPHHKIARAFIVGALLIGVLIAGVTASGLISPPDFLFITSGTEENATTVHITNLSGTGFLPGATVHLTRGGLPDIIAMEVTVVSESKITCTLDLAGATAGEWDVVVTNTDGQFGTLRNGFTVLNTTLPTTRPVLPATTPSPPVTGIYSMFGHGGLPVSITNLIGIRLLPGVTTTTPAVTNISGLEGVHGTISPSGVITVNYGGSQTYTITPDTGYHVADVLVNGESVSPVTSYAFTNIHTNNTIRALFGINTYTITPSVGYGGSIAISDPFTHQVGSVLTAGALTPSGATASYQWSRSLTSGGTYTNIGGATSNTYTPVSGDLDYYLRVTATGTGSYTGTVTSAAVGPVMAGPFTVCYGSTQVLTITPDTGHHIVDVVVDGVPQGAITDYTFASVQEDHTISTTFAPDPVISMINTDSGMNGKTRSFTIIGTGFSTTGTLHVALYYPGTSTVFVNGDAIHVTSSTHGSTPITGQFNLTGSPSPQLYDVKVTNPDGSFVLVPNGFEVT